jgi:hypothetical protein
MTRTIPLAVLAAAIWLHALGAVAEECPKMHSTPVVRWERWRDFFSSEPFGTVGFARNDKRNVFKPDPSVSCVTLPAHTSTLYVVFNHRNSSVKSAGYVSFMAYGLLPRAPARVTLLLRRSGEWQRDSMPLPDPFDPPAYPMSFPGKIPEYERFYDSASRLTIADFDQDFGKLHGRPAGSEEFSWDGRNGMQPDLLPDHMSKAYVMHILERVETEPDVKTPGDPPLMATSQLDTYRDMVVTVSSPLSEAPTRTLRFRE